MIIRKKIFAFLFTLTIAFGGISNVSAFDNSIINEKTIMTGVEYKRVQTLTESGWQDIHIITADLSEEHLALEILSDARGGSYLLNTLEMAKAADAVAAINADFFAAKRGESGRGSAVGMEISDGNLKTTPSVAEAMNVLYQLKSDEALYLNSFEFDIKLTAPNGKTDKIRHINKYDDLTQICLYNSKWGEYSPGSTGGIMEVVVEDGKVVEKRTESEPVKIPENGYVLSSHLSFNTFIYDNLNIGDEVKIDIKSTPDFKQIENAVSGGGILVSEGVARTKFSHTIGGINPRSAVGFDKSGKVITLVAVDGRRNGAAGMTQTELAKFMESLGVEYALNLDGGGSTLLAAKTENGHEVLNIPSDNYKRPVTNSIGIVTNVEMGDIAYIEATSENRVFSGGKAEIKVFGYDSFERRVKEISPSDITFSVLSGEGHMEGDMFFAGASGKAQIKAEYAGLEDVLEIEVLNRITRLEFETYDILLNQGQTFELKLNGYDENGFSAKVSHEDVIISVLGENAEVSNGILKIKSKGSSLIQAEFGEIRAYAVTYTDGAEPLKRPCGISEKDRIQKESELTADEAFRFTVFGNLVAPKRLVDLYAANRAIYEMQENAELHSFLGDVDTELMTALSKSSFGADGYSSFTHKGSTFITVKNTSGGIFSSDKSQWQNLEKKIEEEKDGNIFVFINNASISDIEGEKKAFKNMLSKAALNGSNVFVFASGSENTAIVEDGVRYMTVKGVPNELSVKDGINSILGVEYFLITVNESDVSFELKNILD